MSADDEKISGLYGGAGKPGPSQALDEAILSASRKAVAKTARTGPFSGAWPAFASVAAVVIVAIILVPLIRQEQTTHEMEPPAAEQEPFDLDSAAESSKRAMDKTTPSSAALISLEQDVAEERQALPVESLSRSPAMRTPELNKPSAPADVEPPVGRAADVGVRSRMTAADSAPFAILTPEMWEIRIIQLLDEERIELARAELDRLEQHFPEHEITRELLARFAQLEAN